MATITTEAAHGRAVLRDPRSNRGTAFTPDERRALGPEGLLPAGVQTLDEQARRTEGTGRRNQGRSA
jgi:malate dehydrogenase (oxaloacetate-decarboxylating)